MRYLVLIFLFLGSLLWAQNPLDNSAQNNQPSSSLTIYDADQIRLADLIWTYRVFIIFADSARDPRMNQQLDLLQERPQELLERDLVIILDSHPETRSTWRTDFRPNGFGVILLEKSGEIVFRKPRPWTVREISRAIDKLPLRQQEINR